MDALNELRRAAAEKRDKAIRIAKQEYESTLVRIAELDQQINGAVSPEYKSIAEAIEIVMPDDRPFTTLDIMAGLKSLDPDRNWRARSIDNYLAQCRKRGSVRRIQKAGNERRALYVRSGVDIPKRPFEDMPIEDVIASVLRDSDRPLTQTEIVVRMLEAGYQTEQKPAFLRNQVGNKMRLLSRVFICSNKRWMLT